MGKMVVLKSCPSGRKLKITKNDPSQHLSFFQPSTPARLDKWQKCLGIKLKATNNICHLHFKEEHIKLYDNQQIEQDLEKSLLSQQSYDSLNSHVENETTVKPIESIGDIQKCPMLPQFWMR
ncbi:Protein of unknown function, partial [Cotesia congregata]